MELVPLVPVGVRGSTAPGTLRICGRAEVCSSYPARGCAMIGRVQDGLVARAACCLMTSVCFYSLAPVFLGKLGTANQFFFCLFFWSAGKPVLRQVIHSLSIAEPCTQRPGKLFRIELRSKQSIAKSKGWLQDRTCSHVCGHILVT